MRNSFFCEACGAEVTERSESCPSCGRSFLGIRCPRCGKEGRADAFVRGCPDCGYMAQATESVNGKTGPTAGPRPARPEDRRRRSRAPWPASRYLILSALVIVAVLIILYYWLN